MKVVLLRPANIKHDAGDIVEVSPARADFLFSVGSAKPVEDVKEVKEVKKPAKKATK